MKNDREVSALARMIRGDYGTQKAFAYALNMSVSALSSRLCGRTAWKHDEVVRACKLLHVSLTDASEYFFM